MAYYFRIAILEGTESNDVLNGFGGNDDISGEGGDDILIGGSGRDRVVGGDGNDQIDGGDDDDTLSGGAGNDTIVSGSGDDLISGGTGDDVYQSNAGFEQARINNNGGYFDTDTIEFNDAATNELWFAMNGSDLNIHVIGTDETVIVRNWTTQARQVEQIDAGGQRLYVDNVQSLVDALETARDGAGITLEQAIANTSLTDTVLASLNVWESTTSANNAETLEGTQSADTLEGFGGHDILNGNGGDDTLDDGSGRDRLYGGDGNDMIYGGAGDDNISGGNDNDIINGGAGSDMLSGNVGSDTYVFEGDFGHDRINNSGDWLGSGAIDTARFTGLTMQDVWFSQNGNDLVVNVFDNGVATDNSLIVRNWYHETAYDPHRLEQIKVGSSVLDTADVNVLVQAMFTITAGAPADLNNFDSAQETLWNDTISDVVGS